MSNEPEVVSSPAAVLEAVERILSAYNTLRQLTAAVGEIVPPYGEKGDWFGCYGNLTDAVSSVRSAVGLALRIGEAQP